MASQESGPGALRRFVDGALDLAAAFGVNSKNEGLRRSSQNYVALQAKDRLETEAARSANALETLVARGAAPRDAATSGLLEDTTSLLDGIRNRVHTQPSQAQVTDFYGSQALAEGLNGAALTFGVGACHIGFAVALTERALPEANPGDLLEVEEKVGRIRVESDGRAPDQIMREAVLAISRDSSCRALTLPGPLMPRESIRDLSLLLLTNPGAEFDRIPDGINAPQIRDLWAFGYSLGCAALSAPALAAAADIQVTA